MVLFGIIESKLSSACKGASSVRRRSRHSSVPTIRSAGDLGGAGYQVLGGEVVQPGQP